MRPYLNSVASFFAERSAEELIVGVFLAFLIAAGGAGVYLLVARKAKDRMIVLTVVGLVGTLLAMILTAGYIRLYPGNPAISASNTILSRSRTNTGLSSDQTLEAMARTIMRAADTDHDGKLSADESSEAARRFVKLVETENGQSIDLPILTRALLSRIRFHDGSRVEHRSGPGGLGEVPSTESRRQTLLRSGPPDG